MQERIIVTMTSYGRRLYNLPAVIETILKQTVPADLIIVNLATNESVPSDVQSYLIDHNIEVNLVPDTKVYKKLIPTLKKYPEACVISIDDDFLYPPEMIEEFMKIHKEYPNFPISGNKVVYMGMQCHCGCASLVKADYFGDSLGIIDGEMIKECPSDDMLYTYLATKAGHPYIHTHHEYFTNMTNYGCDNDSGYSIEIDGDKGIIKTYNYLQNRLGSIPDVINLYIQDEFLARIIENIQRCQLWETEYSIHSSFSYRIGKALLKPFKWIKKI